MIKRQKAATWKKKRLVTTERTTLTIQGGMRMSKDDLMLWTMNIRPTLENGNGRVANGKGLLENLRISWKEGERVLEEVVIVGDEQKVLSVPTTESGECAHSNVSEYRLTVGWKQFWMKKSFNWVSRYLFWYSKLTNQLIRQIECIRPEPLSCPTGRNELQKDDPDARPESLFHAEHVALKHLPLLNTWLASRRVRVRITAVFWRMSRRWRCRWLHVVSVFWFRSAGNSFREEDVGARTEWALRDCFGLEEWEIWKVLFLMQSFQNSYSNLSNLVGLRELEEPPRLLPAEVRISRNGIVWKLEKLRNAKIIDSNPPS